MELDRDGSGTISRVEFRDFLAPFNLNLSAQALALCVDLFDSDVTPPCPCLGGPAHLHGCGPVCAVPHKWGSLADPNPHRCAFGLILRSDLQGSRQIDFNEFCRKVMPGA